MENIKRPENWDIEKAAEVVDRVVRENRKWLKEMAKR